MECINPLAHLHTVLLKLVVNRISSPIVNQTPASYCLLGFRFTATQKPYVVPKASNPALLGKAYYKRFLCNDRGFSDAPTHVSKLFQPGRKQRNPPMFLQQSFRQTFSSPPLQESYSVDK